MPDLGTPLLNSETLTLNRNSNSFKSFSDSSDSLYPCPIKTLNFDNYRSSDFDLTPELLINGDFAEIFGTRNGLFKIRVTRINSASIDGDMNVEGSKSLEDFVSDWKSKKIPSGVPENRCFLPFLFGSPTLVKCGVCSSYIYPGDEVSCSVRGCKRNFHLKCAKDSFRCSLPKKFKCPQHACFICKQKFFWRCVRCEVASHDRCAAWPDKVIHLSEQPGWAVCWRHPKDWRQEDIFSCLPLPYIAEEFNIESSLKDGPRDKLELPPYVHIRRNVYLVKKKRDEAYMDIGCTGCCSTSTCSEDCVCRVQSISCSKACRCSEACTNKPFRKEKKIRIVKTELCGWGVEAVESINKGEFIIEYVGEVIDDVVCTQRFWDMKNKEVKNFYMCEIRKDFTIDATFKGNASRFLNHSCDPNCKLEKWQVEGEIRVGVFAARSINVGEPLTYDYRFVQFGPEVKCNCGAANCQGYLGAKRKINLDILDSKKRLHIANICWGSKQKRSSKNYLSKVHKR